MSDKVDRNEEENLPEDDEAMRRLLSQRLASLSENLPQLMGRGGNSSSNNPLRGSADEIGAASMVSSNAGPSLPIARPSAAMQDANREQQIALLGAMADVQRLLQQGNTPTMDLQSSLHAANPSRMAATLTSPPAAQGDSNSQSVAEATTTLWLALIQYLLVTAASPTAPLAAMGHHSVAPASTADSASLPRLVMQILMQQQQQQENVAQATRAPRSASPSNIDGLQLLLGALQPHQQSSASQPPQQMQQWQSLMAALALTGQSSGMPNVGTTSSHRPISQLPVASVPPPSEETAMARGGSTDRRNEGPEPFPQKLYRLLEETENANQEDIVGWMSGGKSFRIHKPREFMKSVAPKYFRHTKMSSFMRQLQMYNFDRVCQGTIVDINVHPHFQRGRPDLLHNVRRVATQKKASQGDQKKPAS